MRHRLIPLILIITLLIGFAVPVGSQNVYAGNVLRPMASDQKGGFDVMEAVGGNKWYVRHKTGRPVQAFITRLTLDDIDRLKWDWGIAKRDEERKLVASGANVFKMMVDGQEDLIEGRLRWNHGRECRSNKNNINEATNLSTEVFDNNQALYLRRVDTYSRDQHGSLHRVYSGIGTCSIAWMVEQSNKLGYAGRVYLHCLNRKTDEFYLKLGMTPVEDTQNMGTWFYFTAEQAQTFLAKFISEESTAEQTPNASGEGKVVVIPPILTIDFLRSVELETTPNGEETEQLTKILRQSLVDYGWEPKIGDIRIDEDLNKDGSITFSFAGVDITCFETTREHGDYYIFLIAVEGKAVGHGLIYIASFPNGRTVASFRLGIHGGEHRPPGLPDFRGRGYGTKAIVISMAMCLNKQLFDAPINEICLRENMLDMLFREEMDKLRRKLLKLGFIEDEFLGLTFKLEDVQAPEIRENPTLSAI
ncbi:MAG: hypothetical protein ABIA66_01930 [Candidatus Omnitrophota bacterium]